MENIQSPKQTLIGPFKKPDNRVIVWELQRRQIKSLPNITSKRAAKTWILKKLKESMFQRDWGELKVYLNSLDGSQLKSLYSIVSDQLVNRNGYVV